MMQDPSEAGAQLEDLYAQMRPRHLYPLWEVLSALVTPEPASSVVAEIWGFDEVRDFLMRAGDLISARDAERRVLILENPGLPGSSGVTTSLYAGLQLILPGEVAPCHRHSQSALRFIMEGDGAFTAVDGEKAIMQPFDLILTPNWQWHDHGNPTDRPMIWLDGLDIPTVRHFDASFSERLGDEAHPETLPPGDTMKRYGRNLRPLRGSTQDRRPADLPLFHYPYAEWKAGLDALAASEHPDDHHGHALEFVNPATGGHVMPTIAAHVRLLPAGFATRPRRSSDGTVMVVVEGQGAARIGDVEHQLAQGDIFVVPSWQVLQLQAATALTLFAYSDRAAQESLGLYREDKL
jgi:gentisate 1,2-dioxygenase